MHVISRTQDESIVIGDNIFVRVIEVCGDQVRLGIEYPDGTTIQQDVFGVVSDSAEMADQNA